MRWPWSESGRSKRIKRWARQFSWRPRQLAKLSCATTIPVLLLAPLGIAASCGSASGRRMWLYLGIMLALCAIALARVHMLAGYCTPRHALVVAWILTLAGGAGLAQLASSLARVVARLRGVALDSQMDRGRRHGRCTFGPLSRIGARLDGPDRLGLPRLSRRGRVAGFPGRAWGGSDRPQGAGPFLRG